MRDYRNIFNKVVPYHTDNSMSLYEFVGRLYEYIKGFDGSLDGVHEAINEFITQVTSEVDGFKTQVTTDIDEFKDSTTGEVSDFIDRFDAQLDETTLQILREWKDDGTLEQIISLVWEGKADKFYVDNLLNQIANTLTDNYTQADEDLRDQINASVGASIDHVQGLITDNTQEIARVDSDLSATDQTVQANTTKIDALYPSEFVPNGTDLHTLGTGAYLLGSTGEYVNGLSSAMYGHLSVTQASIYKHLIFHSATNNVWVKTYNGTFWLDWKRVDSESETAISILEKIKGVDGEGSGLDADLLDGYHGESYVRSGKDLNKLGRHPIVEGSNTGTSYVQFHDDASEMQAYVGFGGANPIFYIVNSVEGGSISLRDEGGGIKYNNRDVPTVAYGTGDAPASLPLNHIYLKI